MVLDPIPQSLPVHFFGSRPQPPTSLSRSLSHTCALSLSSYAQKHQNLRISSVFSDSSPSDMRAKTRLAVSLDFVSLANTIIYMSVWHDPFKRVIWRIQMCDMTHSMCDMTHPLLLRTRPHERALILSRLLTRSSTCECDMTRSDVWHDSRVWHDSFKCASWLIHNVRASISSCLLTWSCRFRVVCEHDHLFVRVTWLTHTTSHTWMGEDIESTSWHERCLVTWRLCGDMTHTHTQLTHTSWRTWMGDDIESMSWHEIHLMTYMTSMSSHDSFPPDPTTYKPTTHHLCCVTA